MHSANLDIKLQLLRPQLWGLYTIFASMGILGNQPLRHCEYCDEVIKGRADKKFCSSECRSGYHNHMSTLNDAYMRRINQILKKNRAILQELCPEGKSQVMRYRLEDRGFNFSYFTHHRPSKNQRHYNFCYEFGYLELSENRFLIVHRIEDKPTEALQSPSE